MKKNSNNTKKNLEKQFNVYMNFNMIISILILIVGIFLYNAPDIALKTVSWIIGIYFVAQGILSIYSYIKKNNNAIFRFNLIYGILGIALGLFVITNPFAIANILTISLGIWLIVSGGLKINYALNLKSLGESSWLLTFAVGIISILFAIMVIINPFAKLVIVEVVGLFLMVYAIIDLADAALLKRRAKEIIKSIK